MSDGKKSDKHTPPTHPSQPDYLSPSYENLSCVTPLPIKVRAEGLEVLDETGLKKAPSGENIVPLVVYPDREKTPFVGAGYGLENNPVMGIGHLEGNRIIDFHSTDRSLQLGRGCHAILLFDRLGEGTGNLRDCLQAACDYPQPTEAVEKMNSTIGEKEVEAICATFMPNYFEDYLEGFLEGADLNPDNYFKPAGTPQFK